MNYANIKKDDPTGEEDLKRLTNNHSKKWGGKETALHGLPVSSLLNRQIN